MGRIGKEAPAENVVATLVTFIASMNFPLLVAFVQRHLHVSSGNDAKKGGSKSNKGKAIVTLTAICAASVAYYATKEPFDEMHQRRMFVLRTENVSIFCIFKREFHCLQLCTADHIWRTYTSGSTLYRRAWL